MDWKDYEKEISELFKAAYPSATIRHDVKITGKYSNVKRQIDILIEDYIAGTKFSIAVEGKFFTRKIDVKIVESFIGMLGDMDVHKGLLITNEGYSKAAIERANNDPIDVELDILSIKELKQFQSHIALPYSGDIGVALPAPFGWIIDGRTTQAYVATLYQRGISFDDAVSNNEWMYINFWHKDDQCKNIDELLEIQKKEILAHFPDATIQYHSTIKREKEKTVLRELKVVSYPSPEYSGYVEFDEFIVFCVLFTPEELKRKNIRKLEYIMANIFPFKIDKK